MGSIPDNTPNIIDIRSDTAGIELKQLITNGLSPAAGVDKTLPTLLLYDERGLKLFERITYLDEYYLTGDEIDILEGHASRIAERIPNGSKVVELGSGNLRKVKILLDALDKVGKTISYYALDLMYSELERTLAAVPDGTFKHVKCFGLWGTYDDGLDWLKRPENAQQPKTILSLGSSIGNFTRDEAVGFVRQFADILTPDDALLVGIDHCLDSAKVYHAYNDRHGTTHDFTINGLQHANKLLGYEAFLSDDWVAVGEYDVAGERHRAFVSPARDAVIGGVPVRKGERIRIEESYKYSAEETRALFCKAGVIEGAIWSNHDVGTYGMHLLKKQNKMFATTPEQYAAHPVPGLEEWHALWAVWDTVTRQMIPEPELQEKPIKLRNACIFYLGHIPTFFDMKLVEATGEDLTEPSYFSKIFERGIDPDVDNPEHCHAHSEVPDTWPDLDVILEYQKNVRHRVQSLYKSGRVYADNWTGRAVWLGFEHEVMHLETLLYMLIQSDKTLPPAGTVKPDFAQLAARAAREAVPNQWFDIPEQTVRIGLNDPDNGEGPTRYFGWDVEKPEESVKVPSFKAQARPISNGDFARYLCESGESRIPASWMIHSSPSAVNGTNGYVNGEATVHEYIHDKAVRTVYGPVPLKFALDWPVSASYDELNGCANYMGGRIPTTEETLSIYEYAAFLKKREPNKTLGRTIPAVNGHLVNEGVEETPPANGEARPRPEEYYVDLGSANVGFKHWHPLPVTPDGAKLAGRGEMGGLWEWTSSPLQQRDGFEPMKLYPAYSADFYDGKHNVVLGGSWATHPRFAGRKSVINWYQRNYPYVWAGARMVKDA